MPNRRSRRSLRHTSAATRAIALGVIGVLISTLLAIAVAHPASASPTPARPLGRLTPATGALFGAHVKSETGFTRAEVQTAITSRETAYGRKFDLVQSFIKWQEQLLDWRETWHVNNGRIPFVSWDGPSTDAINSGSEDAYIDASAARAKAFGHEFFLRWFWEMDADAAAARVSSPESFVNAWRRIHTRFAAAGVSNVVWVWCPTSYGFETGDALRYYPGDAYVDWVCADAFNWAPGRKHATWRAFGDLFDAFHAFGLAHNKPMVVGAFGAQEGEPGAKAEWFRAMAETLKIEYPGISAILYFDASKEFDWRVTSTPASLAAMREVAVDPYFNVRHPLAAAAPGMSVTLDAPAGGSVVAERVTFEARATASTGAVQHVAFYVGGIEVGRDATAPYSFDWDSTTVPNGRYTVHARAVDGKGASVRSAEGIVTVDNQSPPVVTLEAPASDTTAGGSVWFSAKAVPAAGRTITKVEFLVGDTTIAVDTGAPYSFTWNSRELPNGEYEVRARAVDSKGIAALSPARTLNVLNPAVSLTSPAAGTTVRGVVPLQAEATGGAGGTVKQVVFLVAGATVGTDATAPYRVDWDSTSKPNGSYTVTARMTDGRGRVFTASHKITVENLYDVTVELVKPVNGVVENGPMYFSATAKPSTGATVVRVDYLLNGKKVASSTEKGWGVTWNTRNVANGTYDVVAEAFDSAGRSARSATRRITIANG